MVPYRVKYQYGRWNIEVQRKILSLLLNTGNQNLRVMTTWPRLLGSQEEDKNSLLRVNSFLC